MACLSVTVIARDEERDLPGCLASVAFADEVVVVDSGSRDRTVTLARAAGAKVLENGWPGYARQKAFALAQATGDWVLNLDADERCSEALAAEIPAVLDRADVDGYRVRFVTEMAGRTLRFGGAGRERHLRLFRRAKASYPDVLVHEGAVVDGPVGDLAGAVLHRPYASLEEYFEKLNRYTTEAARERARAGRRFSPWCAARLPWGFTRRYLLQAGFLDGYAGFLNASLGGLYDFVKVAKLEDLERGGTAP